MGQILSKHHKATQMFLVFLPRIMQKILLYVFAMLEAQIPVQNFQFFNNIFTMFATKHWKLPAVTTYVN